MGKPMVALVGRQNVGKSTLLNRLHGGRLAVVADMPGTTRDRLFADVTWQGVTFTLVDSGGLIPKAISSIDLGVEEQINIVINDADVVVFLVDIRQGVTVSDEEIAQRLRIKEKPVIVVANKTDNLDDEVEAVDFYRLGLGDPVAVSAYHGKGTGDLLNRIVALLPVSEPEESNYGEMKIAIVGRPNVGKSMLTNALLREDRVIVDNTPGTTRDAIDTVIDFNGQNVTLIDTAGIRRRGQIAVGVERYSVIRSLRAVERADIALLVMDATEMVTAQDEHIAGLIHQAEKGILLLVNKWDLVNVYSEDDYREYLQDYFKFIPHAPLLFISAMRHEGLEQLLPEAWKIFLERQKRVPKADVAQVIKQAISDQHPPQVKGRQLKIFSVQQDNVNPPGFLFKVNDPKLVHFSYRRYLENRLRKEFGFNGTPIRMSFK